MNSVDFSWMIILLFISAWLWRLGFCSATLMHLCESGFGNVVMCCAASDTKKPSKSGMSSQRASWLRCICIKSSLICNFNHLQIWFRCSLSYFAVRLMSSNILKSSKFNFWEAETRECLLLLLKDDLNQQLSINQSNFIYTLLFKQTKSVLQGIEKKLKTIEKVILKTELKNFQDRNNIWIVTIIKVKINI